MSKSSPTKARLDLADSPGNAEATPPAKKAKSAAGRRSRAVTPTPAPTLTPTPDAPPAAPRAAARRKPKPTADEPAAAGAESAPAGARRAAPRTKKPTQAEAAVAEPVPKKAAAKKRTPRRKPVAPEESPPAAIEASVEPAVTPEPPAPPPPPPVLSPSRLTLGDGDAAAVLWHPAGHCPDALAAAALDHVGPTGGLGEDDDEAVPHLLRVAAACGHAVEVDARIWPYLAARRDARRRLAVLQAAYPEGAADAGLQDLLQVALAPFQAEGALWAVVAGRALLADERGLGKSVQAIAAARLWQRHFGLRHVLVVCAPTQCALWRRAWQRLAGIDALTLDRDEYVHAAVPNPDAEVRITVPEALAAGAAVLAGWAPQLVIVDEPQRLALDERHWAQIDAPQVLVLSGAAFDAQPALLDALVERLDRHRLGALAALREVTGARERARALSEAEIERLDAPLSRLLLQRQRADVAAELPLRIWCERPIALAPLQRTAHERARRRALALLAGWRACGWLALADQWPLVDAVRTMRSACHRGDPADSASPLAEATVAALQAQLDDWAADGPGAVALCCASAADRDRLAERLGERPGLCWVVAGEPVPAAAEAVLLAGAPWDEKDFADAAGSPRGRPWTAVIATDSFDSGLFETLAVRRGAPAGPDASGWLEGEALQGWLRALDAALRATAEAPPAARGGD